MQEPLKRQLHRWARPIRRQLGLEGLEKQHEKKMTEISASGMSPNLSFPTSLMQRCTERVRFKQRQTRPQYTVAPLHAYFFMVMSTSGCCLAFLSLAQAHKNLTQFTGYQMDYRLIINSAVWLKRPVVYSTFPPTVSATTSNSTAGKVSRCFFFFFFLSSARVRVVCMRAKTQRMAESGCTKGMADLVLHSSLISGVGAE